MRLPSYTSTYTINVKRREETSVSHLRHHCVQLMELCGELVHLIRVVELILLVLLTQTSLQIV